MVWVAIHTAFGLECIIGDDLTWVCEKAGISRKQVESKFVEDSKAEVWNGDKLWVVEWIPPVRLQFVINQQIEAGKCKF